MSTVSPSSFLKFRIGSPYERMNCYMYCKYCLVTAAQETVLYAVTYQAHLIVVMCLRSCSNGINSFNYN